MKKNILIVCALKQELEVARRYFKDKKHDNISLHFFISGIGNINTGINLTKKLSESSYDFVINYGVCGYLDTPAKLIQIIRSVFKPTGKEVCVPVFTKTAPVASILSSETAIYDITHMDGETYVDMESYSIEKVCETFKIPRVILKVPYDKVGTETRNFDQQNAIKLLEENIDFGEIIEKIMLYLKGLKEEIDTSKYEDIYPFTVSEKIILKKYIQKYIVLSRGDFAEFIKSHAQKEKKEFLATLEKELYKLSKL